MRLFTRPLAVFTTAITALLAATALVYALIVPASYPPRQFNTQQTHYLRFSFPYNGCVLVSLTCSVKVGSVPYNAFITRAYQQVYTAFNAGTTDTVGIGTSSGGVNLVAAQSVHAAGAGTALTVVAANLGTAATGNGATQTGSNGGFDIFVTYTITGAPASAGNAAYIIEYFAPNDGGCVVAPVGSTAPGC
jgi:hypothetical protein